MHDISSSDDSSGPVTSNCNSTKASESSLPHVSHIISDSEDSDPDIFTESTPSKRRRTVSPIPPSQHLGNPTSTVPSLPPCRYGNNCYRKNPVHFLEFSHPTSSSDNKATQSHSSIPLLQTQTTSISQTPSFSSNKDYSFNKEYNVDITEQKWENVFGLYLTQVSDLKVGCVPEISLSKILSPNMGTLKASAQFSYMFEIPWLIQQYPPEFRRFPLLLIHGEKGASKAGIDMEASTYSNISTCQARLDIEYGTHHTKMMLLLYEDGLRVVIHTANMVERDWKQKTQGVWISEKFPPLKTAMTSLNHSDDDNSNDVTVSGSSPACDSPTNFRRDLLAYLTSYRHAKLKSWIDTIEKHDFTSAKVYLIASIPGRHTGPKMHEFGHLKVKKILRSVSADSPDLKSWPLVAQFSSIGSLGADPNKWLLSEWRNSFMTSTGFDMLTSLQLTKLMFPCLDDVRTSLEGYVAGGSLPYSMATAVKQCWIKEFLHKWRAEKSNRTRASPHIKSYLRCNKNGDKLAWFILTSANLSKAAWGCLEKRGSQLMIRSYELGVMFVPASFKMAEFSVKSLSNQSVNSFPVPFDLPLTPYGPKDGPWIVDIPYTDLPDSHGNSWMPR